MVQLGEASHACPHQASGVDDDPHRLAALNLINAGDQLSAPCRRGPANVTILVPSPEFAQPFKLAPDPAHSSAGFVDRELAASKPKIVVAFAVLPITTNPNRLTYARSTPPLRYPP